ncbi:hypothetical protein AAMO2058_001753600 [Amorphochlora amoebiformis]
MCPCEITMDHRFKNCIRLDGPTQYCSLFTDSSDFCVNAPASTNDRKKHYSFKRRGYGMRYAIAVSTDTGDICWLSDGDPAGSKGDITINREGGLSSKLKFFERIGADGAYLCRKDPEYVCPIRRPRGGSLTEWQISWNNDHSRDRTIVENVFSRVKQFKSMRSWHHDRNVHPQIAHLVFGLVQVKNKFPPLREFVRNEAYKAEVKRSWAMAERLGTIAKAPQPQTKRRRRDRSSPQPATDEDQHDDSNEEQHGPRRRFAIDEVLAVNISNRNFERMLVAEHKAGERKDRLLRRNAQRQNEQV